jgi:hypothetical protein
MNDAKKRLPRWDDNIPKCSEDDCPMFDGKRCDELGHRPSLICEPAVREIVTSARNVVGVLAYVTKTETGPSPKMISPGVWELVVNSVEAERLVDALRAAVNP